MDQITSRLQELIDSTGLNNKEFAEKIDLNPSIISHILSGRNKPSLKVIQQITNVYTNVNLHYLLTGAGQLFKPGREESRSPTPEPASFNMQEGVRQVPAPEGVPLYTNPSASSNEEKPPSPEREEKSQITKVNTNVNRDSKTIERVIIFYSDKSMEEYRP